MTKGFDDLLKKVSECSKKTVAVAVAEDAPVLEAVKAAKELGLTVSCVYVSPAGYTLPTGATIVIINIVVFLVLSAVKKITTLKKK